MKKILIIAGYDLSLLHFRGDLIKSWLSRGYSVTAFAPGKTVEQSLKMLGVHYAEIPLRRTGLNPLKDLNLLLKLIVLIRREKPERIFLYTIKPVIYGSLASYFSRQSRVFSLITGLGYVFTDVNGNRLLKIFVVLLYKIALKRSEKVFFQNPDDCDLFILKRIVSAKKTFLVNGSGVNLEYYQVEPLPENRTVFLMIARLLEEKGVREYIDAARLVKKKYPQAIFKQIGWFFGDNPSAVTHHEVELWKKEGIIEIQGYTEDVRPDIAASNVYVLPSYREGTPRTVLEAMAMGRPIITTDVPGCRETVIEGVNGYLVPVKDSAALAAAIIKFIEKPELIEKMGAASRQIAEEKYDVHQVNHEINRVMGLL